MSSAPYDAVVVVASNRASAGVYEDRTGPLIVAALRGWGMPCPTPSSCPTVSRWPRPSRPRWRGTRPSW